MKLKHAQAGFQGKLSALLLFALFIVTLLLVLAAGVKAYQALVASEQSTKQTRFVEGVLQNSVRASDEAGSVRRTQGPEGDALVLSQTTEAGVFETRYYVYHGQLLQEYTASDLPCNPELATPLAATDTFSFSYDNHLLSVTTAVGTTDIALRSGVLSAPVRVITPIHQTQVSYG